MNIPQAVLGLTVLAWGNSLGDMVANVSVARSGAMLINALCHPPIHLSMHKLHQPTGHGVCALHYPLHY